MPIEVTVPRLGWSMDEGTFAEWLIPEGGQVRKGDLLFVLEGDKAAQEIESFDEGTLKLLPASPRAGEKVKVGQVLAVLLAPGETYTAGPAVSGNGPVVAISEDPPAGPASRRRARELGVDLKAVSGSGAGGRITVDDVESAAQSQLLPGPVTTTSQHQTETRKAATPRAKRKARELGIDWTELTGTGRGGRIRERDVIAGAQHESHSARTIGSVRSAGPDQLVSPGASRLVIARRMLESHLQKAPVTLNSTADMTNLVSLREQFKQMAVTDSSAVSPQDAASTRAAVPSFNDLFAKLTAAVLKLHPQLNSAWDDSGSVAAIRLYGSVNIGLAVDTESGLLVPVIANVDQKSLRQVAAESSRLIDRARRGRLTASELSNGTFTITNLGSLGIDNFTPVINGPQCAILGIGRIRKQPVWQENQFVPRDIVSLSLTFDHRIVDGAPAARFLQALVQALESPAAFLIE